MFERLIPNKNIVLGFLLVFIKLDGTVLSVDGNSFDQTDNHISPSSYLKELPLPTQRRLIRTTMAAKFCISGPFGDLRTDIAQFCSTNYIKKIYNQKS